MSCNPGGGTVDCAQWAQVDPNVPAILDGGIIASSGEYRFFADLAANDCDDMAIGYTKSSGSTFPSIWVTGRRSGDPPGTVQAETELKSGNITYDAFDAQPHRWGDYTGMTIDPDGETFWYLGEYSKNTGNPNGRWGTYIGSFQFPSCSTPGAPGPASAPSPANGATDVSVEAGLTWTAGTDADSHDVYFGTVSTPDAGELQGNQTATSFDPGSLAEGTTYYWRIDEVNGEGTTAGQVWNFTTAEAPPGRGDHDSECHVQCGPGRAESSGHQ